MFDSDQSDTHADWYADGIPGAELVIFPGETHLEVCDNHWPEVMTALTRVWT